jgi:hypothetical protein
MEGGGENNAGGVKAYPHHGRTRFLYGAISMVPWGVYVYLSWVLIDHGDTMSYVSLPILGSVWQLGLCGHWLRFESLEARAREEEEAADEKKGKGSSKRDQALLRQMMMRDLLRKEDERRNNRARGGDGPEPPELAVIGIPPHRAPRSYAIHWVFPYSYTACYIFSVLIWALLWIHEDVFGEAFVRPPWVFFTVNAFIVFPLSLTLCPLYVWRG